jgi:uncharacterized protein
VITLVDAGPLVALIDKGQGQIHRRCVEAQNRLSAPLLTSWPCFTEAMYLLGRLRGWPGQEQLWRLWENRAVDIHRMADDQIKRMSALMGKYKDVPMDVADASLVAMAESLGLKEIFTLDKDFYIYRINDKDQFEIIPA